MRKKAIPSLVEDVTVYMHITGVTNNINSVSVLFKCPIKLWAPARSMDPESPMLNVCQPICGDFIR